MGLLVRDLRFYTLRTTIMEKKTHIARFGTRKTGPIIFVYGRKRIGIISKVRNLFLVMKKIDTRHSNDYISQVGETKLRETRDRSRFFHTTYG